jgi:hypothetical protein
MAAVNTSEAGEALMPLNISSCGGFVITSSKTIKLLVLVICI